MCPHVSRTTDHVLQPFRFHQERHIAQLFYVYLYNKCFHGSSNFFSPRRKGASAKKMVARIWLVKAVGFIGLHTYTKQNAIDQGAVQRGAQNCCAFPVGGVHVTGGGSCSNAAPEPHSRHLSPASRPFSSPRLPFLSTRTFLGAATMEFLSSYKALPPVTSRSWVVSR